MKRVLIGIVVMAVLVAVGSMLLGCTPPGAPGEPEATVEEVPVVRSSLDIVAEAVVVPVRDAQLSLPTGGIVAEVLVAEGDQVEAGQVLVRLDSARQEAAVAQAEAQVLRAQNTVAELKAGARPEEIDAARAAVEKAEHPLVEFSLYRFPDQLFRKKAPGPVHHPF